MRKARSLTGLFEWSAVHSDVAEAVSLDRLWPRAEIPGKAKGPERVWLQALAWCATPPL